MKQIILSLSILSMMAIATTSCKKTETPTKAKRITKVDYTYPNYTVATTYSYNNLGQLVEKKSVSSNAAYNSNIGYAYNSNGLVSEATMGTRKMNMEYDAQKRIVKLNDFISGTLTDVATITYSPDNLVRTIINRSVSNELVYTEKTYYDANRNILKIETDYATPTIKDYTSTFGAYDNKKYNSLGIVNDFSTFSYITIPVNNPTTATTINSDNTISSNAQFAYEYDNLGNVTEVKKTDLLTNTVTTVKITWE